MWLLSKYSFREEFVNKYCWKIDRPSHEVRRLRFFGVIESCFLLTVSKEPEIWWLAKCAIPYIRPSVPYAQSTACNEKLEFFILEGYCSIKEVLLLFVWFHLQGRELQLLRENLQRLQRPKLLAIIMLRAMRDSTSWSKLQYLLQLYSPGATSCTTSSDSRIICNP